MLQIWYLEFTFMQYSYPFYTHMADLNALTTSDPEKIKRMFSWPPLVLALSLMAVIGNLIAAWTLYSLHVVYPLYPIVSTLTFFLSLVVITISICFRRSRARVCDSDSRAAKIERISQPLFRMRRADLLRATDNFRGRNVIGRGRFGTVYKGSLPNGRIVAVKCFLWEEEGPFPPKHFLSELKTVGHLRHRNLLRILGYFCDGNQHQMALISQFMPNGSLDRLLHWRRGTWRLGLRQRLNIAVGVASGLVYLHHECRDLIVHCDLKPSNILLDENLEAHIADFGAAKVIGDITSTQSSLGPQWTIGYVAPERAYEMRPSTKGDVYSFGILLLELITGETPTSERLGEGVSLPQWVKIEGHSSQLSVMDDCLKTNLEFLNEIQRALRIAILCTNGCPRLRPDMKDVLKALKDITEEERLRRFNVPVYVLAQQGAPRPSEDIGTSSASTSTAASS